jgi:hypothetical protein
MTNLLEQAINCDDGDRPAENHPERARHRERRRGQLLFSKDLAQRPRAARPSSASGCRPRRVIRFFLRGDGVAVNQRQTAPGTCPGAFEQIGAAVDRALQPGR